VEKASGFTIMKGYPVVYIHAPLHSSPTSSH